MLSVTTLLRILEPVTKGIFIHTAGLLCMIARLLGPGGAKAIVAENLLLRQQLLVLSRGRNRAPNLLSSDRFLLGFWSLFLRPGRIPRNSVAIGPSPLLRFHQYLIRRKYRASFTPKTRGKPGPKGPSRELIRAVVELKRRNPRFGCPRIALIVRRWSVMVDVHWAHEG